MTYVSIDDLYTIFTHTDIIEYSVEKKTDAKIILPTPKKTIFSPSTDDLLECFTPIERGRLMKDFKNDDSKLLEQARKDYLDDDDYNEKLKFREIGIFMEPIISVFGFCPGCNQKTLKCYDDIGIPVVDVICVNKEPYAIELHKKYPRIYQIKVSLNKSKYFTNEYIHTGSLRYGYNSHMAKVKNIKYNLIVVGYICIHLDDLDDLNNDYRINQQKSYVLVPTLNATGVSGTYYTYGTSSFYGKPKIIWNKNAVKTYKLQNYLNLKSISTSIVFYKNVYENPMNKKTICRQLTMEFESDETNEPRTMRLRSDAKKTNEETTEAISMRLRSDAKKTNEETNEPRTMRLRSDAKKTNEETTEPRTMRLRSDAKKTNEETNEPRTMRLRSDAKKTNEETNEPRTMRLRSDAQQTIEKTNEPWTNQPTKRQKLNGGNYSYKYNKLNYLFINLML